MKHPISKIFLLASLLLSFEIVKADGCVSATPAAHCKQSYVYLSQDLRRTLIALRKLMPEYEWSSQFVEMCRSIEDQAVAAPHDKAAVVVDECLDILCKLNCEELKPLQQRLMNYKDALCKGDADISLVEDPSSSATRNNRFHAFSRLLVEDNLNVNGEADITRLVAAEATIGTLTVTGVFNALFNAEINNLVVDNAFTVIAGPTNINTDNGTNPVNIGLGNGGRTISIGSANTTVGNTINIGNSTSTVSNTIDIGGPNAAPNAVIINNTNGAATTTIQGGTSASGNNIVLLGGVAPTVGLVEVPGTIAATVAFPTSTATNNVRVGQVSFSGFTNMTQTSQTFTVINSTVPVGGNSIILATSYISGGEGAIMSVERIVPNPLGGSFTIELRNTSTVQLASNVIINFWVLD